MTRKGNEKCVQHDNVRIKVTLRRVRVTTVVVKKQYVLHIHIGCVCNLSYPACKAHHSTLTNVACLALPYFSTLPHKRHGFRKIRIGHKKRVLIFSTNFVRNISHSTNNSARYYQKRKHILSRNRYSCQILTKSDFFRQISEKINIQFHENPSSGSQVVPLGRTDVTKLIVALRTFANAPKNSATKSHTTLL